MRVSRLAGRALGVRREVVEPGGGGAERVPEPVDALVVGGGIAGMSAAVVLAERGVRVTVLEARPTLGGRLASWPETIADGTVQPVDHGFHAFFRQYYTWRSILRRVDPGLRFLHAVPGYPVLSTRWPAEDFGNLPPTPPMNLLALLARSPSIRLRDLRAMDGQAALPLLSYDGEQTFTRWDETTAAKLLDSLGLPDRARAMLFEVFSHSFFNHEDAMSAAEMLANFHFYFLGNPEGLAFDVPRLDYDTAIWRPLAEHLARHDGRVLTDTPATGVLRSGDAWRVRTGTGETHEAPYLILALDPPALRGLAAASPDLVAGAPDLASRLTTFDAGPPYAVARYWLDGDVDAERAVFSGVSRQPTLDSVTLYHRLEEQARRWSQRTGGSVIELHAYACDDGVAATELAERMRAELAELWPETRGLRVLDLRSRVEAQAPAFRPGDHPRRPRVTTDAAGVYLAGDGIHTDFPSALMERAAATGVLAANHILRRCGGAAEPIHSIRRRGLLAKTGRA